MGKNPQNFSQLAAPKLFDFLIENWPYQQTLRKSPHNLTSPIFLEKSENCFENFIDRTKPGVKIDVEPYKFSFATSILM